MSTSVARCERRGREEHIARTLAAKKIASRDSCFGTDGADPTDGRPDTGTAADGFARTWMDTWKAHAWVNALTHLGWFVGYFLFVYALALAVATVLGVFQLGLWFDDQRSRQRAADAASRAKSGRLVARIEATTPPTEAVTGVRVSPAAVPDSVHGTGDPKTADSTASDGESDDWLEDSGGEKAHHRG